MSEVRLGVNIDHVATLRQARGEIYPSIVEAAKMALESGAHQITIHLREDRRHIQDFDAPAVKLVTERYGVPLNFEMGASSEIIDIAIDVKPDWICLVPEKREEKTTEGGLDLITESSFNKIRETCEKLRDKIPNVKISLFVEADEKILERCVELKADAVEIHTGDYAIDFNEGNDVSKHLESYVKAHKQMSDVGVGFHAGHGLTDESLKPLVAQGLFVEYNIGHWIICQSVFDGMSNTVKKLLSIIKNKG